MQYCNPLDSDPNYDLSEKLLNTVLLDDLTLVLLDIRNIDNNIGLIIKVHRQLLVKKCIYFENLFSINYIEHKQSTVSINVPNSFIIYDIILSFYDINPVNLGKITDWQYYLEMIKCKDYLSIPYDFNYNLSLPIGTNSSVIPLNGDPANNFDILVDFIDDILGYNDKTILMMCMNLPEKYNLSQYPMELIKMMLNVKVYRSLKIITLNNTIDWEFKTNVTSITPFNQANNFYVKFSNDGNQYTWDNCEYISACQVNNNIKYKLYRKYKPLVNEIVYSPCGSYIIISYFDNTIVTWDSKTGDLLNKISTTMIFNLEYSPNGKNIISTSGRYCPEYITIWTNNIVHINTLNNFGKFETLCFSTCGKFIYICFDNEKLLNKQKQFIGNISKWNFQNNELKKIIDCSVNRIGCYNNIIVTYGYDCVCRLWDIVNYNLLHAINIIGHNAVFVFPHDVQLNEHSPYIAIYYQESSNVTIDNKQIINVIDITTGQIIATKSITYNIIKHISLKKTSYVDIINKIKNNLSPVQLIELQLAK